MKKPDRYEFPLGKNMRLTDAIALAGGTSNQLADKVFVIRRREGKEPMLSRRAFAKPSGTAPRPSLLEPGDTVSIEQTPPTVFLDAIKGIGVNLGGPCSELMLRIGTERRLSKRPFIGSGVSTW